MKKRIPPSPGRRSHRARTKKLNPAQVLLDRINEVMDDPLSATQPRQEWIVQSGPEVEKQQNADGIRVRVKTFKMRFVLKRSNRDM